MITIIMISVHFGWALGT